MSAALRLPTPKPRDAVRARLEAAIEAAIAALDAFDGDPDLEPSLGGSDDDREYQCEDEGGACEDEGAITGDDEPWLGAPERVQGYGNLGCGVTDDRELDLVGAY